MTTLASPIRLAREGEPSKSLLAIAVARVGFRRGGACMAFAVCWAIAEQKLGHELGADVEGRGHLTAAVREYSEWWRQSERTTWRELDRFREAFPGEDSPANIAAQLRELRAVNAEMKQREAMAVAMGLTVTA